MITTQKIIKQIAIVLALLLTIDIILTIMSGIISIGTIFNPNDNEDYNIQSEVKNEEITPSESENNATEKQNDNTNNQIAKEESKTLNLEIDINSANIIFKKGTILKVETTNKYINIVENNGKISLTEEKHSWLNQDNDDVTVYIPSNYIFNEVSIETGASKIEIETLNTSKLKLDLGAGKVDINNLNVSNSSEIDGGAGEIIITNGNINNLDLDIGIGKVTITSKLTGNTEINAGIGSLHLNLLGKKEDYKIILDKGLGNATLDNEKIKTNTYYGEGSNLIDIKGGVGNIKIETQFKI